MASPNASPDSTPRKTYRLMATMALVIIALLGLAIFSLSRMQSSPWVSALRDPSIHSSFRKNLPQFEHKGSERSLTPLQFEGKWTLLSFWSYGCPPCLEEMPALNELAQTWQGPELQIITINVDPRNSENLELAKRFMAEENLSLQTYFDGQDNMAIAFAVNAYPKHFLVDPQKQIIWEAVGAFKWNEASARDQLVKLIERQSLEASPNPVE